MRGIECVAPNCAHLHADNDEKLVQEAMRHAADAHPGMDFQEDAARQFVQSSAYNDEAHAEATK
jgi:predicted small metal-binding protein